MTTGEQRTVNGAVQVVLQSLDNIQQEIEDLRKLLVEHEGVPPTLRGLWRGAEISGEDIDEAKHSWMKAIDDFDKD